MPQEQYSNLGRSGLKVSAACLGTMNFGIGPDARCDESEARRIIHAFLDGGHNLIDTANVYTGGQSEQVVGRAIRDRRDAVVLATKAFGPRGRGPNDRGLSRAHLTRALDASLGRLGTDYVDLYQCHMWDAETPIEETMATLDGFVKAGKVRYLGCSNFTAAAIVEAQWASARIGGTPLVSLQPHYSLVARDIEADVLPACRRHGLGTLVYGPLAGGLLSGRYRRDADPDPGTRLDQWLSMPAVQGWVRSLLQDRNFDIADEVAAAARELGTTPTAVAIAWTARRPGVTSVIIGPRTFDQYQDNLAGFALDLPPEHVDRLDQVSAPTNIPVDGRPTHVEARSRSAA